MTFRNSTNSVTETPRPVLDIKALVEDVKELVSPPDICVRLVTLIDSPQCSARDLAEIISRDPNLVARLLRVANSPFYGFSRRIDTISRAVAVLGTRELYSLIVAVSAVQSLSRIQVGGVHVDSFWRHSIYCALIARILAKRCGVLHPERLFVAGLLHDVGILILHHRLPEVMQDLWNIAGRDEQQLHEKEIEALGFGHAQVGAALFKFWNLPESLQSAIGDHHTEAEPGEPGLDAAIVRVADILANESEIGALCDGAKGHGQWDDIPWRNLGLDGQEMDVEEIIGEAGLEFADAAAFLAVKR